MSRYRLTAPIRAIHHAVEAAEIADLCVTLPVGAVLVNLSSNPVSSGCLTCTGRGDTIPSTEGICSGKLSGSQSLDPGFAGWRERLLKARNRCTVYYSGPLVAVATDWW